MYAFRWLVVSLLASAEFYERDQLRTRHPDVAFQRDDFLESAQGENHEGKIGFQTGEDERDEGNGARCDRKRAVTARGACADQAAHSAWKMEETTSAAYDAGFYR